VRKPEELAADPARAHGMDSPRSDAISRDLDRMDRIARLMDAQFRLPVVGTRIGLDGLIGLVPGIGDAIVFVPSAWMIHRGWRHGARKQTLALMVKNSGIDLLIGAIPLVGDIFDIGFKANLRNAALLRGDLMSERAQKVWTPR